MSEQKCKNHVNCGEFVEGGDLCENCESEASVVDCFVIREDLQSDLLSTLSFHGAGKELTNEIISILDEHFGKSGE